MRVWLSSQPPLLAPTLVQVDLYTLLKEVVDLWVELGQYAGEHELKGRTAVVSSRSGWVLRAQRFLVLRALPGARVTAG